MTTVHLHFHRNTRSLPGSAWMVRVLEIFGKHGPIIKSSFASVPVLRASVTFEDPRDARVQRPSPLPTPPREATYAMSQDAMDQEGSLFELSSEPYEEKEGGLDVLHGLDEDYRNRKRDEDYRLRDEEYTRRDEEYTRRDMERKRRAHLPSSHGGGGPPADGPE